MSLMLIFSDASLSAGDLKLHFTSLHFTLVTLNNWSRKASRTAQNGKINLFRFIAVYRQMQHTHWLSSPWLSRHISNCCCCQQFRNF